MRLNLIFPQPFLEHRAVHIVVIHLPIIPRVIRRVYVDALHLSGILRKQGFQGKEVVAFDNQVALRSPIKAFGDKLFRLEVKFFNLVQGVIGYGKVVVPDDVLAFEL